MQLSFSNEAYRIGANDVRSRVSQEYPDLDLSFLEAKKYCFPALAAKSSVVAPSSAEADDEDVLDVDFEVASRIQSGFHRQLFKKLRLLSLPSRRLKFHDQLLMRSRFYQLLEKKVNRVNRQQPPQQEMKVGYKDFLFCHSLL